jgi:predicted MFS family arabinose efflux permease
VKGRINLVAAAFALTALTYGLGRFAYGLLLPHIREDLSLSATGAGWIGGSAFAAYCFGIVFALVAGARLGERRIAVLSSLMATCGLALVAVASSGWSLGLAIALAGLSTGLTSPPLAAAVARCLEEVARPKANGAINAGTAAGIILSGFAVTAFAGGWRELYTLFAVVGAAVTVWLWFAMPAVSRERTSGDLSFECLTRPGVGGLCASAFLMGAASTAIWTFGANIMRNDLGFADGRIALAWSVLGAAGLVGAGTGLLTLRFGIGPVHRFALLGMALALIGLTAATLAPMMTFGVMGLFGVAYIVSSGAFLLWGIALFSDRPDFGLGLPFLMVALGQTAGAPLFGTVWDAAGSGMALLSFAAIMGSAAFWIPNTALTREQEIARPRNITSLSETPADCR